MTGQRLVKKVDARRAQPTRDSPELRRWLAPTLAGLAALFLLTATWSPPYFVDAYTNALQARSFATGSVAVDGYDDYLQPPYQGQVTWLVSSESGVTSQYPPGTALWAAPFYLLDASVEEQLVRVEIDDEVTELTIPVPSLLPAGLAAVASVIVMLGFLGATLQQLMPAKHARWGLLVAALGTGVWSIAADMLWQHGPAMMGISAGVYFASRRAYAASGLGFSFAILVRPHTAVIAAAIGLTMAIRQRRWRPVAAIGATSVLGLVGLALYNRAVFGAASISGGYGNTFTDRFTSSPIDAIFGRAIGLFVDDQVGLFFYSPVLIIAFLGLWAARSQTPDWALGAAIGAVIYMLIQIRANRISGGDGFFGYRYPLEALVAAGPMLVVSARAWVRDDKLRRTVLAGVAAASVAIHATGAITTF